MRDPRENLQCVTQQAQSSVFACINRQIGKLIYIAPINSKESLSTSVAKQMSFQRLSEGVEGKSRPPESRWKVVPQSRTGGRETPITEFMCYVSINQSINVKFVRRRYTTRPVAPTVVSDRPKHDHKVHS